MRLTDERIDEILRKNFVMCETELECLAREVRDLRDNQTMFGKTSVVNTEIKQLTRELAEARELWCQLLNATGQYDHANALNWIQAAKTQKPVDPVSQQQTEPSEKAAFAPPEPRKCRRNHPDDMVCELCAGKQQPEPSGELVPWDAETRPKGPVTLRRRDRHWYEFTPAWEMDGDASGEYRISWKELCVEYEWSRDGKTWERCGVVR